MGPKRFICGTPALIVAYFDFIRPIFTRCLRWQKAFSRLITKFGSPNDAHLVSRVWLSTLSNAANAFLKSTSSMRIMIPVELSAVFSGTTLWPMEPASHAKMTCYTIVSAQTVVSVCASRVNFLSLTVTLPSSIGAAAVYFFVEI